jgi:hypothetical protein
MIELINNLGINSTSGLLGLGLLIIGFFLIFAGTGIISIEKVTVKQGKATWIVGIVIAVIGGFLIYPEFAKPGDVSDQAGVVEETQASTTISNQEDDRNLSEWKTPIFLIPDNGLWHQEGGKYTAIGSEDTIAWSEETYTGDIEISLEIESFNDYAGANIIVYGNGISLSSRNLIFTVGDMLAIVEGSIYQEDDYTYVEPSGLFPFGGKHTAMINIKDRRATLFVDGVEISSVFLKDTTDTEGKIGLLKYWEFDEVTFSNIQVKGKESP